MRLATFVRCVRFALSTDCHRDFHFAHAILSCILAKSGTDQEERGACQTVRWPIAAAIKGITSDGSDFYLDRERLAELWFAASLSETQMLVRIIDASEMTFTD